MTDELQPPPTERERALELALEAERRKRRRVQFALATAVLLILGTFGAFAWQAEQEAQRAKQQAQEAQLLAEAALQRAEAARDVELRLKAQQARDGVRANLKLADDLRSQFKFKEAQAALTQAAGLAVGVPELLSEVERAQRDFAHATLLDDIQFRRLLPYEFLEPAFPVAPPPREVKQ